MTATVASDRGPQHHGHTHRAHPQHFPHPKPVTVEWAADEDYPQTAVLNALKIELDKRMRLAQRVGTGRFQADTDTTALLVFLDAPMEVLVGNENKANRKLLFDALRSSMCTGVYVALTLTRADQDQLRQEGWGTELLEWLRRDSAGYPVYGNW